MKIEGIGFSVFCWNHIRSDEHRGQSGTSFWRVQEQGNVRVRLVEYSPGFRVDHWCARGHVLLILEGELTVRLKDAREFQLTAGSGFIAGDDEANPHLAISEKGAKVLILD